MLTRAQALQNLQAAEDEYQDACNHNDHDEMGPCWDNVRRARAALSKVSEKSETAGNESPAS